METPKGTEYLDHRFKKGKSHKGKESLGYPSFNKINKAEDLNYCLGGEDEKDLKLRLQKFSDSTCLPVVLAPG